MSNWSSLLLGSTDIDVERGRDVGILTAPGWVGRCPLCQGVSTRPKAGWRPLAQSSDEFGILELVPGRFSTDTDAHDRLDGRSAGRHRAGGKPGAGSMAG